MRVRWGKQPAPWPVRDRIDAELGTARGTGAPRVVRASWVMGMAEHRAEHGVGTMDLPTYLTCKVAPTVGPCMW